MDPHVYLEFSLSDARQLKDPSKRVAENSTWWSFVYNCQARVESMLVAFQQGRYHSHRSFNTVLQMRRCVCGVIPIV